MKPTRLTPSQPIPDPDPSAGDPESPYTSAFNTLSRVAQGRATVYCWLATAFYPPDDRLSAAVQAGTLVEELRAATTWLGDDQHRFAAVFRELDAFRDLTADALAAVYDRSLGKGIDRVPPYESAYRWRDMSDIVNARDDLTRALAQTYSQYGVSAAEGEADHIAVELEFLGYLCTRETQAWAAAHADTARELRRQQRNFLDEHLGRWASSTAAMLNRRVPDTFYAAAGRLCDQWLQIDHGPGYVPAES